MSEHGATMNAPNIEVPVRDVQCHAYETVAIAIRYLLEHSSEQPDLAEIARHVGLSPYHLQRIFSERAGVSPKRFLQFLTKEHARQALRESADVLTASFDAGLSSPGRLHDLLVACDAVTPGEVRALGEHLAIDYGIIATPFGPALIGATQRGVCHLRFLDADEKAAIAELKREWPLARLTRNEAQIAMLAAAIFEKRSRPLHLMLKGTNFQVKVWEALLRVPEGAVTTYSSIARAIGMPRASRAVGTAIGRNSIAYLIPCHRVIRESGALAGYRWGTARKAALIVWEAGRNLSDLNPTNS